MKKVTLDSAKKEGMHALLNAVGVVGGVVLMRMISAYANPWAVPAIGIVAGYGARLAGSDEVREIGSGVMAAGTIVLAKKGADALASKVPFFSKISQTIPSLNGAYDLRGLGVNPFALRGMEDYYAPAEVVSTRVLR